MTGLKRDCDLCKAEGRKRKAIYDAKTRRGPWAYLCEDHYKSDAHPAYEKGATKLEDVPDV